MQPHFPGAIVGNVWILAGFAAWMTAQFCKLLSSVIQRRDVDFAYFVSTGGMPSAHSATVSSLATAVGITEGFDTATFAVAFALAAITMFDASTVRLAAGRQARILNQIVQEMRQTHKLPPFPKLKELLGHTRFEVLMGMAVGILVGANVTLWWMVTHSEGTP